MPVDPLEKSLRRYRNTKSVWIVRLLFSLVSVLWLLAALGISAALGSAAAHQPVVALFVMYLFWPILVVPFFIIWQFYNWRSGDSMRDVRLVSPDAKGPVDEDLQYLCYKLALRLKLRRVPMVGIAPGDLNAFTTGTGPEDAVIVIGESLLHTLTPDEVEAVIAHEYGHIVNGDFRTMAMLAVFGIALEASLTPLLRLAGLLSGAGRGLATSVVVTNSRDLGGVLFGFCLMIFALTLMAAGIALFLPLVIMNWIIMVALNLVTFALNRRREYRADAVSALLVGPEHIASALQKLDLVVKEAARAGHPEDLGKIVLRSDRVRHPYFLWGLFPRWFESHPSTRERVEVVRAIGTAPV